MTKTIQAGQMKITTHWRIYEPYKDEPLADCNDINDSEETAEEADVLTG